VRILNGSGIPNRDSDDDRVGDGEGDVDGVRGGDGVEAGEDGMDDEAGVGR
jgi:hypothetical protein